MVYIDVIRQLKNMINGAGYQTGDLLPAENALAARFGVSRNTLRKALRALAEEGLIEIRHGAGTWVQNKQFQTAVTHLDSFTEIARREGKTPISQVLKFEMQPANEEIASGLQLQPGENVYYAKRLRLIDNIAMQLEETWLSISRFPNLTLTHMQRSKYHYIEQVCGIKINGCYESIVPVLPTRELATLLHISPRDPIIKMQTQAVDDKFQPLDYSILYTNMFEFQVKYFLPRQKESGPR